MERIARQDMSVNHYDYGSGLRRVLEYIYTESKQLAVQSERRSSYKVPLKPSLLTPFLMPAIKKQASAMLFPNQCAPQRR